jgi:hypothetical protein
MRGISWLAAKTGQLLKKDCAVWDKVWASCNQMSSHILVFFNISSTIPTQRQYELLRWMHN